MLGSAVVDDLAFFSYLETVITTAIATPKRSVNILLLLVEKQLLELLRQTPEFFIFAFALTCSGHFTLLIQLKFSV